MAGLILFFSRGRGRGHALADIEIAHAIQARSPETDVRFVSYATGAETFAAHGVSHIDLGLPERNPINETIVLAGKLIGGLNPDIVLAHEEFMALPAAKIFDKPTVLITDWFAESEKFAMGSLRLADRILFLDDAGIYQEPEWVSGKVDYVGPVLREFRYRRKDRLIARQELGLHPDTFLVGVFPGGWAESEHPVLELVTGAFALLPQTDKRMVWLAGKDEDHIRGNTGKEVIVLGYDPQIDRVMAACNVAVTKGTRKTLFELQSIGVPSVSIANPLTQVDRFRAARFPANTPLDAKDGPEALARRLIESASRNVEPTPISPAASRCAAIILECP